MSPTSEFMAQVSLAHSYQELFRVTGPLQSIVLRTEDMWRRHNQYYRSWRDSQSGFPLLTPTMQAGQDSDGGVGGRKEMGTLHAGVMLCIVFITMLPDRVDDSFTSTIRLYLSPSQLCLIKRMSNFKVTYLNVVDSYSKFF